MNFHNLFPTPVAFFEFKKGITKKQKDFISELAKTPNEGNTTSVNRKLFDEPVLKSIAAFVQECVDQYFVEVYKPKFDVKLEITQSWANYSEQGQWHHKHRHPNSLVSGCFYVSAVESDNITFFDDREYKQIDIPTENYNLYNSQSWWLPIKTNDVVLFPSSLAHMVPNVTSNNTRISIAFNTFPKGYIGNDDSLTGLHL